MLVDTHQEQIQKIFAKYPDKRSAVMALLYVAQEEYGWITPEAETEIAKLCEIDPTQVHSITGFYTMYREAPKGKYWLQVCTDLACALKGAEPFYKDLLTHLDVENGDTTADGMFTVDHVTCLAACDKAPMLQCNFHYVENLDMEKMKGLIDQWRKEASAGNGKAMAAPNTASAGANVEPASAERANAEPPAKKPSGKKSNKKA